MPKAMNLREIRRMYEVAGPVETAAMWEQALTDGEIKPGDVSVRDLFEGLCGPEALRALENRKSGGLQLKEAINAIDTSTFSYITGQLFFTRTREEYQAAALIGDQLVTEMPTSMIDGEKFPGFGGLGDEAEIVEEGYDYPLVGIGPEYTEAPPTKKRGFIVPVTREAIIYDRTGLLLKRASDGGKWLAINREKRILDLLVGTTNNYKRNGTATNTYLTSGAYINQHVNALVDWTDIENAELLYDAMLDPNTGEPIGITTGGYVLVVPTALRMTALRIANATEVRYGDAASNTTAYYMGNPLANRTSGTGGVAVISSPYVKARSGSATTWFYGIPRSAFNYSVVWNIETSQAPAGNSKQFNADIEQQYKVSERGVAWVGEPRYMTKNTAS